MGLTANSTGTKVFSEERKITTLEGDYVIALAGNPNVGKSTIFNSLTRNEATYRKLAWKNSRK